MAQLLAGHPWKRAVLSQDYAHAVCAEVRRGKGEPSPDPLPAPQLPVPMAVLMLLSKERLLTCCPQRRPLLLSADELALETQPPEKEDASSLPPKFQSHPGRG